jgi:hypothetical protein
MLVQLCQKKALLIIILNATLKIEIKYFWKNNRGLEREDRKHDTDNTSTKEMGV